MTSEGDEYMALQAWPPKVRGPFEEISTNLVKENQHLRAVVALMLRKLGGSFTIDSVDLITLDPMVVVKTFSAIDGKHHLKLVEPQGESKSL